MNKKMLFIDRVNYFPLMAFEITDDVTPEFLFWDRDFLLIEENGIENFSAVKAKISSSGGSFGFSVSSINLLFLFQLLNAN